MLLSKTKLIAGLVVIAVTGGFIRQAKTLRSMAEENRSLRAELADAQSALRPEETDQRRSSDITSGERRELLRLRGEVGVLRNELASIANGSVTKRSSPDNPSRQRRESSEGIGKMNRATGALTSFLEFASRNEGALPTNFAQVQAQGNPNNAFHELTNEFEIVSTGNLTNVTSSIILRERQAWQGADGIWNRTYGFVDGHT